MVLDTRLRERLTRAALDLEPDVEAHLARSNERARARRVRRRSIAILAVAAALALVAGLAPTLDVRGGSAPPASRPDTSRTPVLPSTDAITGPWQTRLIEAARVRAVLRAAGLEAHAPLVVTDVRFPSTIKIAFGANAYETYNDRTTIDTGTYTLNQDILILSPADGGQVAYRVSFGAGTLRLRLISDTAPDYRGVPDEAFQRAIYTSAEFHPM